jgi:hypothetical protein
MTGMAVDCTAKRRGRDLKLAPFEPRGWDNPCVVTAAAVVVLPNVARHKVRDWLAANLVGEHAAIAERSALALILGLQTVDL